MKIIPPRARIHSPAAQPSYQSTNPPVIKTRSSIAGLLALACLFGSLLSSRAATLVVTNPADSGPGALRDTIAAAASGDTITFSNNLSGATILLTSGELLLTNNLTIDASVLSNGIAIDGNGTNRIFEVTSNTTVVLDSLTITNGNTDNGDIDYGGGIFNQGTLTVNNSTLVNNSALEGGGICNIGTLTVNDSTLANNSGGDVFGGGGGGIYNNGTLTINNSTLSGNSDRVGGSGGGILNQGTLTVNNSTLAGNSAGGVIYNARSLTLTNTIVAGNTGSSGTNIYNEGSFTGSDNLTNGVPLLAALGNYGGPTQTMPPLPGSPAIDAGDDSVTNFLTTDQRGLPRLSGVHVDIGAVEVQFVAADTNNPPVLMGSTFSTAGGTNSFQFTFTNVPDADFTALASTNVALPLADWIVLGNIPEISSGQYQFTDPGATNYPQRFYRVVSP